jgi:hypothetical protein
MRIVDRLLLATLCIGLFAGCNDVSGPRNERSRLDANREKWLARGSRDYSATVTKACFCGVTGPVAIVVNADTITSATQVSNGQAVDPRVTVSVSQLFDFIARAIDDRAERLDVTYDDTLGFPRSVSYDGDSRVADDEISFTVTDVTPIAPD